MSRSLAVKRPRQSVVFRAAIAPPVEALVRADPHLRVRDDAESVHAARVATRKLRSDLRLFRPLLEPTWAAEVRACLKRLASLLGAVRDADVLTARVGAIASRLPAEHVAAVASMLERLRGARATADDALRLQLSAFWYINLLQTLIAAAQDVDGACLTARNDRVRARKFVARVMRPTWKRLKAAVRRARHETDGTRLHRIRIRAKACRYAAEAIGPFVPESRRDRFVRFVHHIAQLQEQLGNVHDAALDQAALRALTGVDAAVVDEIVERESAAAAAAQAAWRTIWKKLSCRRSRFW
jgi:CHAD domain-containing protein